MYTGGVINIATKSGTNSFHGGVYEYVRNTILDATDFFTKRGNKVRPHFIRISSAVILADPVWRDKAFFFFDYQGYRQIYGYSFRANTPTLAELEGRLLRSPPAQTDYYCGGWPHLRPANDLWC